MLGEKYSDFNRGIGLFSHGIGAGSLIYLRRVFEILIEDAHKKAVDELPEFDKDIKLNKMDEKIHILKDYLPNFLVENRKIHGILSKGIHELTEDKCLEIFPVIKLSIELILDEKIEAEERERKRRETKKHLEKLSEEIK